jgi:hypothetical protein
MQMKKPIDFQSFLGTRFEHWGSGSTGLLTAFVFVLGTACTQAAAEDSLDGGVNTEQSTDDSVSAEQSTDNGVSADTDVKTSGDTGDCHVSAHASASSTSNGETVSRQSEKKVDGPCGKASASAKASSSNRAGGTSTNGN